MKALDFTSIILGILTFVNGFGWFFDRKKHKEEVQGMKADNKHKEMDLAKKYVDEYDRTIAQRLRNDVNELRNELNQMKDVLHKIQVCPYLAECPVLDELLERQKGSKPEPQQPEA
jgi:Tfp pilus assembly protein PilO